MGAEARLRSHGGRWLFKLGVLSCHEGVVASSGPQVVVRLVGVRYWGGGWNGIGSRLPSLAAGGAPRKI